MSTVDVMDEISTKFQTGNDSSEELTTLAQRVSAVYHYSVPFKATQLALAVLGVLTNAMVLGGFFFAGRIKMNSSSALIANHTTLELSTALTSVVITFVNHTQSMNSDHRRRQDLDDVS